MHMEKNINILVTGAKGFVGKNLVAELRNRGYLNVLEFDRDTNMGLLDEYIEKSDFIFHLAGVNRPQFTEEYMEGNYGLTMQILDKLKQTNNKSTILLASSIQAKLANPYGISKKAGEDLLFEYSRETGVDVLVYRFNNLFGKWCKPNYNSVVATFCHNIANDLPIKISDRNVELGLSYIDDVLNELILAMKGKTIKKGKYYEVEPVHYISLGKIADLLYEFANMHHSLDVPNMSDPLIKKLHATYLSYVPKEKLIYSLKMNQDSRGSFTEIIRNADRGQISVNVSKPGVTKGNHWHHTKNEKFVVVSGEGVIYIRNICTNEVFEYHVSGNKIQVIDIPTGCTHSIINQGDTDMVTIMWCNECFDPKKPDTYYQEVSEREGK